MEKILITGINGFIGSNLAYFFIEKGYQVYGTVRPLSNLSLIQNIQINKITVDLCNIDEEAFPDDFDYIIHCASVVSDFAKNEIAKKNIFDISINFYEKVIKKQKNLKKFIYISTSLVLGYKKLDISEKNPGKPIKKNYYVYYKKKTEEFFIKNCTKDKITYTILRPADVYGPRDRTSCYHMLKAIEGGFPVIVGSGNYIFPFCSSRILCEAVENSIKFEQSNNKIYTITSGFKITWKQFFKFFQKKFNKLQWIYIPEIIAMITAAVSLLIHRIFPNFKPSLTPYRITRITSNTSYDISEAIKDLKLTIIDDYEKDLEDIYRWYIEVKGNSQI